MNLTQDMLGLEPVATALALGLLVGVQRGWAAREGAPGSRFAGVRTFALIGLAGGFAGAFKASEAMLSGVILAAAAALVLLGYWRASRSTASVSGTASLVALLTLACGYLAGAGDTVIAVTAVGLMVMVLAMRTQLHGWVAALTETEMLAIGRFALIAMVVLPLLPDTPFGPYGAWRARQLWLVVVMVCGLSLVGYLAARRFGATRGGLATAAAGSMVSSTAVTASLAGKIRAGEGDATVHNAGIALGSAVMFMRVMVLTAVLAPDALQALALFAVPGMLVSLAGTGLILRRAPEDRRSAPDPVELRNPFDIGPALLLAALVMALTLVARWVLDHFGNHGLATVLAITGVVDVDSAIITLGNLPHDTLAPRVAGLVLAPPILLNSLLKAGIALGVPRDRSGASGGVTILVSAAASAIAAGLILFSA